jgi:hypothetical protein
VDGGPIHRNGGNLKFMAHSGAPTMRSFQLEEGDDMLPVEGWWRSERAELDYHRRLVGAAMVA